MKILSNKYIIEVEFNIASIQEVESNVD